jgi:hypothetical protein
MNIIFLDIDGVLNIVGDNSLIEKTFEYNKLMRLIKLSNETDSKIIITSDRRTFAEEREMIDDIFNSYNMNYDYLSLKITHRKRSEEILYYLSNNSNIINYVILDDNDLGYSENIAIKSHFIDCYNNGFGEVEYEKALEILDAIK